MSEQNTTNGHEQGQNDQNENMPDQGLASNIDGQASANDQPDSRLDHDTAWDIGHASERQRSAEAYHRQVGQLAKGHGRLIGDERQKADDKLSEINKMVQDQFSN